MNDTKVNVSEAIISEIKPLQLSKASAEGHAEALAELVKSGEVNPLDMATRLRYIMNVCDQALKQIQPECVAEADTYDKKENILFNNAKIQAKETGVKYNYESTGDPVWKEASTQETLYAAERKKREDFLKTITAPMSIADESTGGEMVTIHPARKTSTRSVQITFEQ